MDRPRKKFPAISFALFAAGISVALQYYYFAIDWQLAVLTTASALSFIFSTIILVRQHRFLQKAGTLLDGVRRFEANVDQKIEQIGMTVPSVSNARIDLPQDLIERLEKLENQVQDLKEKDVVATPSIETPLETQSLDGSVDDSEPLFSNTQRNDTTLDYESVEKKFSRDTAEKAEIISKISDEERIEAAAKEISNVIPMTKRVESNPETAPNPLKDKLPATLENDELQMLLQPILSLEDKSINHYEAYAKLSGDDENLVDAREFLEFGEDKRLVAEIDFIMLEKIFELQQQLSKDKIEAFVFWNMSPSTLSDKKISESIFKLLSTNKRIATRILPEISQSAFLTLTRVQKAKIKELTKAGMKLSLDQCNDAAKVKKALSSGLFGYVKTRATKLLEYTSDGSTVLGSDISEVVHAAGASLMATQVDNEEQVINLIDYDVAYGQGNLFSPPRPAKREYQGEAVADTGT